MATKPGRKRGRPRKNPDTLARWTPPEGWVRVVAWVAPEDREALKAAARDAGASVADLIRALAQGLDGPHLSAPSLLAMARDGRSPTTMHKIPTLFQRDDRFRVIDTPRPECAWVFDGLGVATEKLDGTNIRLTLRSGLVVRVEKRRNPNKAQKQRGIIDGWYVDAPPDDPSNRWIHAAVEGTDTSDWADGEHACEALGPKIQGNPLGLDRHVCVPFNFQAPEFDSVPRTYDGLRAFLAALESKFAPGHMAEGLVFHHPDGRRAKIKRKDFGLKAA